ncbi:hypothetical protein QC761_310780 [Podospora bellae-mahoneyi]|uniref:ribonuclease H n=1 Tax=Podospora bellae-mahoneyi TaxID=2093777 RepID=A0ABR0FQ74_9PEZI|nr:hypothetical protein QC761_310780 [Podospora bellae-mahoneyi]
MLSVWSAPSFRISGYCSETHFHLNNPQDLTFLFSKNPQHFPETNINNNNPEHWIQLPDSWRKGAGLVFPTEFTHPSASATPTDLFKGFRPKNGLLKYVHRTDAFTALIFIAGTCPDRRIPDPKAGWALIHARAPDYPKIVSARLERKGPFGDDGSQTSNRAELRAALATLRFEFGPNEEGFRTLVIVINSKYVVEGSTTWAETWIEKQWKTSKGEDVASRDLWEALLSEIEKAKERNMAVQFWKIPKEWNVDAHDAAMKATEQPATDSFQDLI